MSSSYAIVDAASWIADASFREQEAREDEKAADDGTEDRRHNAHEPSDDPERNLELRFAVGCVAVGNPLLEGVHSATQFGPRVAQFRTHVFDFAAQFRTNVLNSTAQFRSYAVDSAAQFRTNVLDSTAQLRTYFLNSTAQLGSYAVDLAAQLGTYAINLRAYRLPKVRNSGTNRLKRVTHGGQRLVDMLGVGFQCSYTFEFGGHCLASLAERCLAATSGGDSSAALAACKVYTQYFFNKNSSFAHVRASVSVSFEKRNSSLR